eukprot:COSAG02_NODE_27744_length_603_cov_1.164683_1_plen_73_part_00
MNKERPASAEEAASALSRALLSVGQGTPPLRAVAKSASDEDEEAEQADEYEEGLEPDSLDEDEDDDQEEDDA